MKHPFLVVATLVAVMAGVSPADSPLRAQPQPGSLGAADTGHIALGLAIRRLNSVTVLQPNHPLFTYPNRIDGRTWQGWVQERGLYFLGEKDARYVDLVQMEDPFPYDTGTKSGALVEATVGKGRWLYVGLSLWRQVPAGTDGAYQLLANIISLPNAPATPTSRGGTTGQ
jgi:hypothetical protein